MAVLGMKGTGHYSADERPKNYRGVLILNKPNTQAPLTALLGQLRNEMTDDPEFKVFTKGLPTQRTLVSGTQTTGETVIELQTTANNTLFVPGHAIMNERTGEVMWVSASSVAGQITVARGKGSTAATVNDGDGLFILSSAYEEGADVPEAVAYDPTVVSNWTQNFRNSLKLTGTAQMTRLRYAENPTLEAQRETLELHAMQMEKQFLFGSGVEDTSGAQPKRTTKGAYFFLTTNVQDFADAVDIDTWEVFLKNVFANGSDEKLFLCGNTAQMILNRMARIHGQIQLTPRSDTFGMLMQTYTTPFGTLQVKQHPQLSKNPTFSDWGFTFDTAHIVYRYMKGRDTRYMTNRQSPGTDGQTDEYLSEAGFEVQFEDTMGVCKNMSTLVP